MAQIFVSHSARDEEFVNFFTRAFATVGVQPVFEQFERIIVGGQVSPEKVEQDIKASNALFVILSENVQNIPHTRDWVVSESGVARGKGIDVWVFEPFSQVGRIEVIIPGLTDYVVFETTDPWFAIIREIIQFYEPKVLPAFITGGIPGAALGAVAGQEKNVGTGAALGALAGTGTALLWYALSKRRPSGGPIKCPACQGMYHVLVPPVFRCPVCNTRLQLVPVATMSSAGA